MGQSLFFSFSQGHNSNMLHEGSMLFHLMQSLSYGHRWPCFWKHEMNWAAHIMMLLLLKLFSSLSFLAMQLWGVLHPNWRSCTLWRTCEVGDLSSTHHRCFDDRWKAIQGSQVYPISPFAHPSMQHGSSLDGWSPTAKVRLSLNEMSLLRNEDFHNYLLFLLQTFPCPIYD